MNMKKTLIRFALLSLIAVPALAAPTAARADIASTVVLEGSVQNFTEKYIELALENDLIVRIPRATLKESSELKQGKMLATLVDFDQIQIVR
jgi:hypothetical protein